MTGELHAGPLPAHDDDDDDDDDGNMAVLRTAEICVFRCHKEPLCASLMCLCWHLNQNNYWLLRVFVTMATPPPSLDLLFMVVNRRGEQTLGANRASNGLRYVVLWVS